MLVGVTRAVARRVTVQASAHHRAASTAAPPWPRFQGKSVIVTGAANGIGEAIATAFWSEGARVAMFDWDAQRGMEVSSALAARSTAGATFAPRFSKVDVSSESDVSTAVAEAAQAHGGVDILINNAAIFLFGDITSVSAETWNKMMNVNVLGYAFTQKHAMPLMEKAGGGAIVNISSISAFFAQRGLTPYNVTKAAVLQMTRSVAMDGGPKNIRANAVCPGPILTDATMKHAATQSADVQKLGQDMINNHMIIKRMGKTSEVAAAVTFLASDAASFITGSHIMVDGGYSIC